MRINLQVKCLAQTMESNNATIMEKLKRHIQRRLKYLGYEDKIIVDVSRLYIYYIIIIMPHVFIHLLIQHTCRQWNTRKHLIPGKCGCMKRLMIIAMHLPWTL